ncbi:MAG: sensor histidine kinase [Turicibacter sp.]
MISPKHELFGVYLVCFILLTISLYSRQNFLITFLFLFIMLIIVGIEHYRKLKYIEKLSEYEEAARSYHQDQQINLVAPLIIDQEQILGIHFNKLMRTIEQQENNNKRNRQIIKIITNNIEAPIVILNIEGEIEYANNRFKEWAELSVLKKMSFNKINHDDLKDILQDALICETTRKNQLRINQKDYISFANPIFDQAQEFTGTIIMFHDITDIKKYETLQKEFFANASHELKTPISAIKGCTEILLNGAKENTEILDEFLSIIEVENSRMEQLVKDLLLINRFEFDQIAMKQSAFKLNQLLVECVLQSLNFANIKDQKIMVLADTDYEIRGDYVQLKHCFSNLLANAIHYSPESTVIKMIVTRKHGYYQIEVKDQGIGIPGVDLPHIFERFYRVDKARSRNTGGTGLGLSIVQSIVEAHKGTIQVDSQLNVGTTFKICLPS